jgi:hypothetical protein
MRSLDYARDDIPVMQRGDWEYKKPALSIVGAIGSNIAVPPTSNTLDQNPFDAVMRLHKIAARER